MSTLAVDDTGDLSLPLRWITDTGEEVAIRLRQRLKLALGEWFLDPSIGVPYYRYILVKNPDLDIVRSILRKTVLTTPGVDSVTEITATLSTDGTRQLFYTFSCTASDGSLITGTQADEPFVVTP